MKGLEKPTDKLLYYLTIKSSTTATQTQVGHVLCANLCIKTFFFTPITVNHPSKANRQRNSKVDMPLLTCIFFTFNWLTLTSEMHFVKFHPVVASCLLSRGKRKYAPLGMRLLWKYIRNYFLVYQLISPFVVYLQNYKEFEAEILDLQIRKIWAFIWYQKIYYFRLSPWGENVIGIRAFNNDIKILEGQAVLVSWSKQYFARY